MSDEHLIFRRYVFALSSFARMFRPPGVTHDMKRMCRGWAEDIERPTPMHNDLDGVDAYYLEMWKVYSQDL